MSKILMPIPLVTSGTLNFASTLADPGDSAGVRTALWRAFGGKYVQVFRRKLRQGATVTGALVFALLIVVENTTGHRPSKDNALILRRALLRERLLDTSSR